MEAMSSLNVVGPSNAVMLTALAEEIDSANLLPRPAVANEHRCGGNQALV